MDAPKINELRILHKDLATYLSKHHKVMNNCILAVAAIRVALASDPALRRAYKASLREIKAGTFLVDQGYENAHQTILKRLKEW